MPHSPQNRVRKDLSKKGGSKGGFLYQKPLDFLSFRNSSNFHKENKTSLYCSTFFACPSTKPPIRLLSLGDFFTKPTSMPII